MSVSHSLMPLPNIGPVPTSISNQLSIGVNSMATVGPKLEGSDRLQLPDPPISRIASGSFPFSPERACIAVKARTERATKTPRTGNIVMPSLRVGLYARLSLRPLSFQAQCRILARSVSSCVATIRPKSGVKPTCRDSSTDAIDPERTFGAKFPMMHNTAHTRRCDTITCVAQCAPSPALQRGSGMFELPKVAQSHRQPDFRLLAGGREGRVD